MSKSKLPKHVEEVKAFLDQDPSYPNFEVAQKLMSETPDHISMWKSLERRKIGSDSLWVWAFLEEASKASKLPQYHYMSVKDRNELSNRMDRLSKELSQTLRANEFDTHIVYIQGKIFNGFYCFEDLGYSNQQRIEADNIEKLKISTILNKIAERSKTIIAEEPLPGKTGKNVRAIRFIRIMSKHNRRRFKTPLNKVIATAANSIFETQYSESDIRKLLSR